MWILMIYLYLYRISMQEGMWILMIYLYLYVYLPIVFIVVEWRSLVNLSTLLYMEKGTKVVCRKSKLVCGKSKKRLNFQHSRLLEALTDGEEEGNGMRENNLLNPPPPTSNPVTHLFTEGLDGVNWQLTNRLKFYWQLSFASGFIDNWQRTWLSFIFYKTRL